jgi:hypothetical protein
MAPLQDHDSDGRQVANRMGGTALKLTTLRHQDPSMRDHIPKEEEEWLGPKWYWYVNLWTQD